MKRLNENKTKSFVFCGTIFLLLFLAACVDISPNSPVTSINPTLVLKVTPPKECPGKFTYSVALTDSNN